MQVLLLLLLLVMEQRDVGPLEVVGQTKTWVEDQGVQAL